VEVAPSERILVWLEEDELRQVPTSEYWNDEDQERAKPYYILNKDPQELLRFLHRDTSLHAQYLAVLNLGQQRYQLRGTGVDVAAGVCWTTALLSREPGVEKLYAIEVSKHRLLRLAPPVCEFLGAVEDKIIRAVGSFYDIRLSDGSVDFCMMCQAFHHADDPERLLRELQRILKPGGIILMIGEDPVRPSQVLKRRVSNFVRMLPVVRRLGAPAVYKLAPSFDELYPADEEGGDHYYRPDDYERFFRQGGFSLQQMTESGFTVFVATKD
jgi:ubiquinone/menaquinone biosynthesis C-methylase UbiE